MFPERTDGGLITATFTHASWVDPLDIEKTLEKGLEQTENNSGKKEKRSEGGGILVRNLTKDLTVDKARLELFYGGASHDERRKKEPVVERGRKRSTKPRAKLQRVVTRRHPSFMGIAEFIQRGEMSVDSMLGREKRGRRSDILTRRSCERKVDEWESLRKVAPDCA